MVKPLPDPHTAGRPPARTKERKIDAHGPGLAWVKRGLSFVTEGLDYLDAFYDAIEGAPKRPMSPEAKARYLYAHWQDVDMAKAMQNLAANAIEDYVIGKAQKTTKDALINAVKRLKLGTGFRTPGTGPSRMVDFL